MKTLMQRIYGIPLSILHRLLCETCLALISTARVKGEKLDLCANCTERLDAYLKENK